MKVKTFGYLTAVFTIAVSAFVNAAPQSEDKQLDASMECPACESAGHDVLLALHDACGTPITTESFTDIKQNSPIVALMVGIKSFGDEKVYQIFRESAVNTIQCDNMQTWPERARRNFEKAMDNNHA